MKSAWASASHAIRLAMSNQSPEQQESEREPDERAKRCRGENGRSMV
jgi:hypothetical protein